MLNAYLRNKIRTPLYTLYSSMCINKLKDPQKIIMLLSHMRAGSTLTVNLLCTNPEIIGIGETHINYSSEKDFKILRGRIYSKQGKLRITEKYILDNINHDRLISNQIILANKNIICIFLIRNGESTLSSLLNPKFHFLNFFCKKEDKMMCSYNYYKNRLFSLENYAKLLNNKEKSIYITYEQLIHETNRTFTGLREFLGTQASFSEYYSPLSLKGWFFGMGTVGGDKSDKIVSGKIIRQSNRPSISLPEEIVSSCSESYEKAHATLQKYCSSINDYM